MRSETKRGASSLCSIQIDEKEESNNAAGLNFVVFDSVLDRVITAKRFNVGNTGRLYTEKKQFPQNIGVEELVREAFTDRYLVVISVKSDEEMKYSEEEQRLLASYGIATDGSRPYIAVWDEEALVYQDTGADTEEIRMENYFSGIRIEAVSGNTASSVSLNGASADWQDTSCNFAVYDKYTKRAAGFFGYCLTEYTQE